MKKLALTAVVSLVASLCLAVSGGTTASADPYVGYVPTNCRVKVDHNGGKNKAPRILTLVEVPSSRAHPTGTVDIVVKRQGEVIFSKTFANSTGKTLKFFAPKWARARKYTAKLTFTPLEGSVYIGCERRESFTPKKK